MTDRDAPGQVDQLVVRWLGGQDKGLGAAGYSVTPERAAELLDALGPLLRVEDSRAQPSLVRAKVGSEVALVRRWPVRDRHGRPSTASHLLVGPLEALPMRECLLLRDWPVAPPEFAEQESGQLPRLPVARLRAAAWERQAQTEAQLPVVRTALVAATAALLADPRRHLSLLGPGLPDWPAHNHAALVVYGLHGIFGPRWLQQHWTFATYDTVDSHRLLVTTVPQWRRADGRDPLLTRLDPSQPLPRDLPHELARQLVGRFLERPRERPLLDELAQRWSETRRPPDRRLPELERVLRATADRAATPGAGRPAQHPDPVGPPTHPEPTHHEPTRQEPTRQEPERQEPARQEPARQELPRQDPEQALLEQLAAADDDWAAAAPALAAVRRLGLGQAGAAELCRLVLAQQLWFYPAGPDPRDERRQVTDAAELFAWAVRPQLRDPAQERRVSDFLHVLAERADDVDRDLLNLLLDRDDPPDLPPRVWCRLLRDLAPRPARSAAQSTAQSAAQPSTQPGEPSPTPTPVLAPEDPEWVDPDWADPPVPSNPPPPPAPPPVPSARPFAYLDDHPPARREQSSQRSQGWLITAAVGAPVLVVVLVLVLVLSALFH
ncbi:hypothetical protein [Kitasatospora viridis]|uniref:Uncharacterized protein n=1 Tax=Kitasatospora viridis TaxID=281105 RepID=A0A561SFF8_9ACTN|nr:hypothetical protein [Kitasatospora viridis]TWF73601.1 hypothetical protein FHX73_15214 [Kitasatospora viridis]